jgi:predicted PurR-regulated permease PerM
MAKQNNRLTVTISPISFVYLAVVAAAVALLWFLSGIVILIVASIIFAAALNPSVTSLQKLKIPRPLAVTILYVLVFGILGLIVYLVTPTITQQIQSLLNNLPDIQNKLEASLAPQPWLLSSYKTLTTTVTSRPDIVLNQVSQTALGFGASIFGFVTILVLTFYFLLNSRQIANGLVKYIPSKGKREEVLHIASTSSVKLGHWIRGQLLTCLIVFVVTFIVLSLLGVPYSLTLALIAGVLQFIPFVGAVVGAIPAVLVAFTISPIKAVFVVIFFIILQMVIGNIVVPQVMKKAVGVSPIIILIAALVGFSLLGVLGVLLAVPIAAVIDVVFESLGSRYVKEKITEVTQE